MKIKCMHCDGPLEVEEEMLNQTVNCPHCNMLTRLLPPQPPPPTPPPPPTSAVSLNDKTKDQRLTIYFNEFPKDSGWTGFWRVIGVLNCVGGIIAVSEKEEFAFFAALASGLCCFFFASMVQLAANTRWLMGNLLEQSTKPKK